MESSNINSFLDSLFQGNDSKMSFSKVTFPWNRRAPVRQMKKPLRRVAFLGFFTGVFCHQHARIQYYCFLSGFRLKTLPE